MQLIEERETVPESEHSLRPAAPAVQYYVCSDSGCEYLRAV
jgi:hypothetical protein